jgi:hydroxymethylpyrimidine/phosphomethylpyrimidine kinase
MAVVTALTAQNTQGVAGVWPLSPEIVAAQIASIINDLQPDAIKIGMVATTANARAVAQSIFAYGGAVVLDPVLVPTQGVSLAEAGLATALTRELLSCASLVTPNLFEAAALTNTEKATTPAEMAAQGRALIALGARAVLVKGGDLAGAPIDVLVSENETSLFRGRRIVTRHAHGTGCALSAAITAELAKGAQLAEAIKRAKRWLENALAASDQLAAALQISGRGPPDHLFALRDEAARKNLLCRP